MVLCLGSRNKNMSHSCRWWWLHSEHFPPSSHPRASLCFYSSACAGVCRLMCSRCAISHSLSQLKNVWVLFWLSFAVAMATTLECLQVSTQTSHSFFSVSLSLSFPYRPYFELKSKYYLQLEVGQFSFIGYTSCLLLFVFQLCVCLKFIFMCLWKM